MRRKTIAFLLLALIVVAGVVFVEWNGRDDASTDPSKARKNPLYRVVVGGGEPAISNSTPLPTADVSPDIEEQNPARDVGLAFPPEPPVPPRQYRYTVRKGDVLGEIAIRHLGSASPNCVKRIATANNLKSPNAIREGQILVIPVDKHDRHTAAPGETLGDVARIYYGAPSRTAPLFRANPHLPPQNSAVIPSGTTVWVPR